MKPVPELTWLSDRQTTLAGRDLRPAELGELLRAVADAGPIIERMDALQPVDGERDWELLHRDDHIDIWAIAWSSTADTGWHDHDASSGAFHVVSGQIVELRPSLLGQHRRRPAGAGTTVFFGPEHMHRVTGSAPRSTTLHAYSPPLSRMGRYNSDDEGVLSRDAVSYSAGLLPGG
jgi:hypothetical protein